jgi:hypothetical protein
MQTKAPLALVVLILGDVVIFGLVTVAGFSRHGELGSAGLRLFATFLPLCIAWALAAPWLGVFNLSQASQALQLWRPLFAMLLAAPMAGWLRGLWLGESIPPIFVLVIGAFSALGILLWRGVWIAWFRPRMAKQVQHG